MLILCAIAASLIGAVVLTLLGIGASGVRL